MKQRTQKRLMSVFVTIAGIFVVHQLIRRFFIEEVEWIFSVPSWVFTAGAILILLGALRLIVNWIIRSAEPIDDDTSDELEKFCRERKRLTGND